MRGLAFLVIGLAGCGRWGFGNGEGSTADADYRHLDAFDHVDAPPGTMFVSFGETGTATHSGVTADAYLDSKHKSNNYGTQVDGECDPPPKNSTLLRFDLGAIPTSATIVGARLQFYVTSDGGGDGQLLPLLQSWTEAGVTWNTRDGSTAWSTAGAMGPGSRGTVVLGVFPAATGPVSCELNSDGIAAITGWVHDPATNFGLAFVATTSTYYAATSDATDPGARPLLVLAVQ